MDIWTNNKTCEFDFGEDEERLKLEFAAALVKTPNDPFTAAREICGMDTRKALHIANYWTYDRIVRVEFDRLQENLTPEDEKEKVARLCWRYAELAGVEDAHKYIALYMELRNLRQKPGINVGNSNVVNNVLIVREGESFEDWEREALEQQRQLTAETAH